jgi:hypothetical protein
MKLQRTFPFVFCYYLFMSACASVLVAGASGGIAYTFTNVAYKTILAPIDQVEFANRLALIKMRIRYVESTETRDGEQIIAETSELRITIDIERITPETTRISVNARKNILVKDKSTAAAIIEATEAMLEKD